MSFNSFHRAGVSLSPDAIALIQGVFDQVCDESECPKDSIAAKQAAAVLIRSYQRGITDREILTDIARAVIRQPAP